jgi:hypothetical protein
MRFWIPMHDEMQPEIQKLACDLLLSPLTTPIVINFLQNRVFAATRSNIVVDSGTSILANLKSHMDSNRALWQSSQDSFKGSLRPGSGLVVVILRVDTTEFVSGNKFAASRDDKIVQDVADAKLLA